VGPLIALIIAFGVYPKPLLDIINPAVHQTLVQMHATDPVAPHPVPVTYRVIYQRGGGSLVGGAQSLKGTTP